MIYLSIKSAVRWKSRISFLSFIDTPAVDLLALFLFLSQLNQTNNNHNYSRLLSFSRPVSKFEKTTWMRICFVLAKAINREHFNEMRKTDREGEEEEKHAVIIAQNFDREGERAHYYYRHILLLIQIRVEIVSESLRDYNDGRLLLADRKTGNSRKQARVGKERERSGGGKEEEREK